MKIKLEAAKRLSASVKQWRKEKWAIEVPNHLDERLDTFEEDDGKAPSRAEAVKEAEELVKLYKEGGSTWSEDLAGDSGPEAQKDAKYTLRNLALFIRRNKG